MCGASLGIIGMGRIGQAVAKRASGFDMAVLYHNPKPEPDLEQELGAKFTTLPDLLQQADILSLHVPLTPETAGMIGSAQFKLMKPHAILVNTSRGGVVDTPALVFALKNGQIAYAALDVTDPEPLPPTHALYSLPNAIILPHLGSATRQARSAMSLLAVDNLIAGLQGEPLPKAIWQ